MLTLLNTKNIPILKTFIITCITLLFWLLHTNQSSSQSAATILLLFAPFTLFFIKDSPIVKYKSLIIVFSLIILFTIFNFLILTQHEFNKLSLSTYRALFFWLLFPIASILIWKARPSSQWVFIIFSLAAIFSLSPVIRDYMSNNQRGFSSGHPIFWGDIALCSGIIAFVLSKSLSQKKWAVVLGYSALICGLTASFWSQTRGGWISIPISFLMLLIFRSITKAQASIGIIILVITIFSIDTIKDRVARTFQNSNVFSQPLKLGSSTQQRLDMWGAAWEIFKENPVLGNGFSSYHSGVQELVKNGSQPQWISSYERPHNEYLNTLVSSGIIGFIILASIIISMLYIFNRLISNTPYKLAGYLLISQFLIFSISEVFFTTKLTIVYFCIAAALLIYLGLNEEENVKFNN
jgi:O-antigen ligase